MRGFGIFLACIVLGVATIAGVGSVARGMTEGLANEGRAILGGDLAVTVLQREATPEERAWLAARGTVSEVATLRAIARRADGEGQALVELKAVDDAYPARRHSHGRGRRRRGVAPCRGRRPPGRARRNGSS